MGEQTSEGQLAEEVQEPGSKFLSPYMRLFLHTDPGTNMRCPLVHTERKGNNQVLITAYLFPMTIHWGDYSQSLSIFPYKNCMY